jgi:hypothetical protein
MNTVSETWKNTDSNAARAAVTPQPMAGRVGSPSGTSSAVLALARQLFSAGSAVKRRRVLFVAADAETKVSSVAEDVARAVATMQVTVALVDTQVPQLPRTAVKKPSASVRGTDSCSGFQVSERLWKIPLPNFLEIDHPVARGAADFSAPFDCVVFSSVMGDSSTPLFCSLCDGAVLLLRAGRTRRDVALRGKQILAQFDLELLGTVLIDRTFPVPESIYRRL